MGTKKCYLCKKILSISEFKKNISHKDGLQSQCISCQKIYRKSHYEKNREKYIIKAYKWRLEFQKWWKDYKLQFSCSLCDEKHPSCIEFHHYKKNKDNDVSFLIKFGNKKRVLKEIEKCIPLCSNCHKKLHWNEQN